MSADNMPPLPGTHPLWQAIFDWDDSTPRTGAKAALKVEAEVHAYARAYADERTRELGEALQKAVDWIRCGSACLADDETADELAAILTKHRSPK